MPVVEIIIPACVGKMYTKKKGFKLIYLNLNQYRNWNGFFEGSVKKKFTSLVAGEMQNVPKMKYINQIEYTLIVPNKKKRDRMNVYSIVDKYFCDALQKYEKIEDDSDDFIGDFIFKQSIYMKDEAENIRVLVKITFDC